MAYDPMDQEKREREYARRRERYKNDAAYRGAITARIKLS
jgi:hypothetical protein